MFTPRALAFFSALAAFALAAQAVNDHSSLLRAGYEISSLESEREELITSEARAREEVGRLASPAVLALRAKELGLATDYPTEFPVVRIDPDRRVELDTVVLVQGR
ncbi:MAG: hypothetical protein ABFS86_03355 [Planctomycetota bacterium]